MKLLRGTAILARHSLCDGATGHIAADNSLRSTSKITSSTTVTFMIWENSPQHQAPRNLPETSFCFGHRRHRRHQWPGVVNGQPAKDATAAQAWSIGLSPTANPGDAIADTQRASLRYLTFEILKPDGTPIGTIVALGPDGGPPPPGAPLAQSGRNLAIAGGAGAFLGGQYGAAQLPQSIPNRSASLTEDSANLRENGSGRRRFIFHLIPMSGPEPITAGGAPAITHSSDFTAVTASKPATAGETVALYAAGSGPTTPGVDRGGRWPEPGKRLRAANIAPGAAATVRLTYLDRLSNEVMIAVQ